MNTTIPGTDLPLPDRKGFWLFRIESRARMVQHVGRDEAVKRWQLSDYLVDRYLGMKL